MREDHILKILISWIILAVIFLVMTFFVLSRVYPGQISFFPHSSMPACTAKVPAGKCAHASTNQATKGHS